MPGPFEAVKHVSAITELQKVLKRGKKKKKRNANYQITKSSLP